MIVKILPDKLAYEKWVRNGLVFLIPVAILYLTTIIGVISPEGHTITPADFIPTKIMIGGMILYILNNILDYLKKLRG